MDRDGDEPLSLVDVSVSIPIRTQIDMEILQKVPLPYPLPESPMNPRREIRGYARWRTRYARAPRRTRCAVRYLRAAPMLPSSNSMGKHHSKVLRVNVLMDRSYMFG